MATKTELDKLDILSKVFELEEILEASDPQAVENATMELVDKFNDELYENVRAFFDEVYVILSHAK